MVAMILDLVCDYIQVPMIAKKMVERNLLSEREQGNFLKLTAFYSKVTEAHWIELLKSVACDSVMTEVLELLLRNHGIKEKEVSSKKRYTSIVMRRTGGLIIVSLV